MGIIGLNHFITGKSENVFKIKFINALGKSVAIDTTNWLYSAAYNAIIKVVDETDVVSEELNRANFMKYYKIIVIEFIEMWISNGITPYFIFDGKAPIEKKETQSKRREKEQELKNTIQMLKEEFKNVDRLLISPEKVSKLRTCMKQDLKPSTAETKQIKDLIFSLGFPVLQCKEEGEKLCSALSIHKKVDFVFSTDTDNLTYGAPLLVNKMLGKERDQNGNYTQIVRTISSEDVLKLLEFTQDEFIEFCIGCGCDYNTNMKRIGPATMYKLIKQYKSLDNLPPKYDTSCLIASKCRELFKIVEYEDMIDGGNLEPIQENYINYGKRILESLECKNYIKAFNAFYGILQ